MILAVQTRTLTPGAGVSVGNSVISLNKSFPV